MRDVHAPREVTVRGIVVPTEWSHGGRALRVAILTPDEEQYDVVESGPGKRLLEALREEVEARVLLEPADGDRRSVTVVSYEVVDEEDLDHVLDHLVKEPDSGRCDPGPRRSRRSMRKGVR